MQTILHKNPSPKFPPPLSSAMSSLLLAAAALLFLSSSAAAADGAQTCQSHTFSRTITSFNNCTNLPPLKSLLYWTFNPTASPNPTLSVAFVAPPPKSNGWIAWGLNPTGTGMLGAQALVAYTESNGSAVVRTYNISSYSSFAESPISYRVLRKSAEKSGGLLTIFATLEVPVQNADAAVNHVWQVGESVSRGVPVRHAMLPENLNSKGTLTLSSVVDNDSSASAPSLDRSGGGPTAAPQSGTEIGDGWSLRGSGIRLREVLVLLAMGVFWGF